MTWQAEMSKLRKAIEAVDARKAKDEAQLEHIKVGARLCWA